MACYIREQPWCPSAQKIEKKIHTATYLVAATFYLHDVVPSTTDAPFKSVERHGSEYDMVFKLHLFENRYKKCFASVKT